MAARRRRTALWGAVTAAVVASLFVAVLATRKSAEVREADSPLLGKPHPTLTGTTVDGKQFTLPDEPAKWVVVNVFASWCGPCHEEHPELVRFANGHAVDGDAAIVGLTFEDEARDVRAFFRENGGDWPVVNDTSARKALDWGVRGPPETYVVAPNGIVVAKFIGAVTAQALDGVITRAEQQAAAR